MNNYEIGSYRLTERLPGSHSTYLAVSTITGEKVVIKTVMGDFGAREWANISDSLSRSPPDSSAFCPVLELGIRKELTYAVAPYMNGINLQQAIKTVGQNRALLQIDSHVRVCAHLIAEIAGAIVAARSYASDSLRGVIVSSEEFLVTRDGRAMMLDPRWIVLRTLLNQPRTSSLVHSVAYQVPGKHRQAGGPESTFVWGLCTILWELCTGYRLFRRTSLVETLQCISERDIPVPSSLNPLVPRELDALLLSTLRTPEETTLQQLAAQLQQISQVHPDEGSALVSEWVGRIAPVVFIDDDESPQSLGVLEALLDDDEGVLWTFSEDSSTFIEPPPTSRKSSGELSWLETSPNTRRRSLLLPKELTSHEDGEVKNVRLLSMLGLLLLISVLVTLAFKTFSESTAVEPHSLQAAPAPALREVDLNEVLLVSTVPLGVEDPVYQLEDLPPMEDEQVTLPAPHARVAAPRPTQGQHETPPAAVFGLATGDVAVVAPQGVSVYLEDLLLGTGSFRTTLQAGAHLLRLVPSEGPISYLKTNVRAGSMSVLRIAD